MQAAQKVLVAVVFGIGGVAVAAIQKEAEAAPAADQLAEGGLEEVIVTARRREETMQSVPIAITALSAESLKERGVKNLSDVANFAPNVTFDQGARSGGGPSSSQIYIRGIGQDNSYATSDPAVGIYIDGVYYGRTVGSVMDIVDLDRVEVLRGPQGTLFGKNTMGGAISLISSLPTGRLGGYVQADYGRLNERNFKGSLQFPISDGLAAKLSLSSRKRDGYEESRITGIDQNDVDSITGRAILNFTLSDAAKFVLTGDVSRVRQNGQAQHLVAINPNAAAQRLFNQFVASQTPYVAFDGRWISNGHYNYSTGPNLIGPNINNVDLSGVSGDLEWDLSDHLRLTSITAYRRLHSEVGVDADGTPLNVYSGYIEDEQDQVSQELRLGGDSFGESLKWLAGVYYFHENMDDFIAQRILDGLSSIGVDITPNQYSVLDTKSYAGFGQAIIVLNEKLSATLGIRYTKEEKSDVARSTTQDTGKVLLPEGSRLEGEWSAWTPKASLDYKPRDGLLTYVSVAQGFKSGGINYAINTPTDFQLYDPEEVTTYEIGFKSDWPAQKLRVNGAVFYSDYKDLQFSQVVSPGQYTCPSDAPALCNLTINAAAVEIMGAELEVTARPLRGLDLSVGVGYTENKFKEVDPALLAGGVIDFDTKLPKTPKWSGNIGAQYQWPMSLGVGTVRADYAYKANVYTDIANTPQLQQEAFGLLSARAAFETLNEKWEFALTGQNLTDELYITSGFSNLNGAIGYAIAGYGAPRTYIASVRYRFAD